jgi:hypothetical protein
MFDFTYFYIIDNIQEKLLFILVIKNRLLRKLLKSEYFQLFQLNHNQNQNILIYIEMKLNCI